MEFIAIIGSGCRFPNANNPESFWELLRDGVDAITEIPPQRWDIDAFYDPLLKTTGKMNGRWGGFLEQVDQFDSQFFGISPREVERMDPQQRLLLEVAWESLENAGIKPSELNGSKTGVFIGASTYDYGLILAKYTDLINAYNGIGTNMSILSNRLSYVLNLRGPSLVINTACSSSLVALHYACKSLLDFESNLCLVGGVNLILSPEATITLSQAQMMAADGRCKTFDASADGYVRGEGCGLVVLKRLSEALRDRDNIQAVIRGSAVNQDGLTNGITAPNGLSQQLVIRQAIEKAGIEPAQISYVEAHGTGTLLGDPLEIESLKTVLQQGRSPKQPCWIGSVKTNIGHLEAAGGIASIIKVVLSLQHREIPRHLHLKQLNPHISLEGTPFFIPTKHEPWCTDSESRFVGISAFSFGGTNCHVILEQAPILAKVSKYVNLPLQIFTLSAKSQKSLQELVQKYQSFLKSHTELSLSDICFTASTGRMHLDHRLAIIAESRVQLLEQLEAFNMEKITPLMSSRIASRKSLKVAFLFIGEDLQYSDMGRQLYETQPTFRKTLDSCDEILCSYLEKPLLSVLYPKSGEPSPLDETAYIQPAVFALEYALAELWKSWGIEPSVVMGYGVGEYVAACVAGVFSLKEGLRLILEQGRPTFNKVASEVNYMSPQIDMISNVTGKLAGLEIATSKYWCSYKQQLVQFAVGMETLRQQEYEIFLEIGINSTPLEMTRLYLSNIDTSNFEFLLSSLSPRGSNWQPLLQSLSALYLRGAAVNWTSFYQDCTCHRLPLPTYAWQRQRHWLKIPDKKHPKEQVLTRDSETKEQDNHQSFLIPYLKNIVAKVLGLEVSQLDIQQPLNTVGLDSLMAFELMDQLSTDLKIEVSEEEIFTQNLSIADLAMQVSEQIDVNSHLSMPFVSTTAIPSREFYPENSEEMLAKIDDLTDKEVDSLLISLLSE